ncbi:MAG: TetR/AcrR family transcriptional regulator [Rhodospirillales bacterium]|nr:TetR/AcrR family transcriptional regulator [Rhodospirillales bacterium]MCB9996244.1 TetR/AcrR family transcriptional regulator [Rhodospirillales bacterium]
MSNNTTRHQIVEAADRLFYQRGYEHTSFADIADTVKISRGNFYYHFKSKDDILEAVIDLRLSNTKGMLNKWEAEADTPAERIKSYIRILLTNWNNIKQFGCPVGTLCTELAKLNHASQEEASAVFTVFRVWLRDQFTRTGHKKEADTLALRVLAWSQGVATMASTFQDEQFVRKEVERMCCWVESLTSDKE